MPAHTVARELIFQLGAPITGTSANKTGGPDPATATEVRKQLGRLVDLIIDGGACPAGRPSTVVDITTERPVLLRQGAVSLAQIEEVCGALA
jgi:tRNA threonylcarbamoyl adenosine modification protein (Sua5/YciO/YrdC/YwlC family)